MIGISNMHIDVCQSSKFRIIINYRVHSNYALVSKSQPGGVEYTKGRGGSRPGIERSHDGRVGPSVPSFFPFLESPENLQARKIIIEHGVIRKRKKEFA
jgi:hypothetical protein